MGAAIIAGIKGQYTVVICEQDSRKLAQIKKRFNVRAASLVETVKQSHVIILAVKPQNFDELLKDLKGYVKKNQLVISIAAGITTKYIEKRLGSGIKVVRSMPNLPVKVKEGMIGVCKGKKASSTDVAVACQLFNRIGKTVVVDEKLMDAITAVSGSGPAYVFYFVEVLEKIAKSMGLKAQGLANELVMQTLKGSILLLEKEKTDASVLRQQVTSKGGTTQAALEVIFKNKTDQIFAQALLAARKRARALSK